MSTTPPPKSSSSWKSTSEPATPDTPYHSVKESHTDTSDFSDTSSIDHFSDATEGIGRGSNELEDPFQEDEEPEGAHTPHIEQRGFTLTLPIISSSMSSEDTDIPTISVERTVDDHPVYGTEGHPNKDATAMRSMDAKPDFESEYHDSTTTTGAPNPAEPGKNPDIEIPTLVVEKTADDHDVYGTVQGTEAYSKRTMDAKPDVLTTYEDSTLTNGHPNPKASPSASPISGSPRLPAPGPSEADSSIPPLPSTAAVPETFGDGDDFDDFGETVESGDGFDDFGDFDSADPMTQVEASHADPTNYKEQVQRQVGKK